MNFYDVIIPSLCHVFFLFFLSIPLSLSYIFFLFPIEMYLSLFHLSCNSFFYKFLFLLFIGFVFISIFFLFFIFPWFPSFFLLHSSTVPSFLLVGRVSLPWFFTPSTGAFNTNSLCIIWLSRKYSVERQANQTELKTKWQWKTLRGKQFSNSRKFHGSLWMEH